MRKLFLIILSTAANVALAQSSPTTVLTDSGKLLICRTICDEKGQNCRVICL